MSSESNLCFNEIFLQDYPLQGDICRLCLNSEIDGTFFDLKSLDSEEYRKKLMEMIKNCIGIDISVEESQVYPKKVCFQCANKVKEFYDFKNSCHDSDIKIREFYKKEDSDVCESKETVLELCDDETGEFDEDETGLQTEENADEKKNISKSITVGKTQIWLRGSFSCLKILKLSCNLCHLTFKLEAEFLKHNKNVHNIDENNRHKCFECQKTFLYRNSCAKHERHYCPIVKKKGFSCRICKENFSKRCLYESHLRQHEIDGMFDNISEIKTVILDDTESSAEQTNADSDVAKITKEEFTNALKPYKQLEKKPNDTTDQIDTSKINLPLKKPQVTKKTSTLTRSDHKLPEHCTICHERFATEQMLTEHRLKEHGIELNGKLRCFGCSKEFRQTSRRAAHERICKSMKDGYQCLICKRFLPKRKAYEFHMKAHRLNKIPKLAENLFQCCKCKESFKTRESLNFHMKEHKGSGYVCEICGRSFAKRIYYVLHSHTHTGVKNYACEYCPYRASQKTALVVHKRIHTGERPFQCEYCPQRCVNRSNLLTHVQRHLHLKKYQCHICQKTFGYKDSRDVHISVVHEKSEGHSCPHCNTNFTRKGGLNRHLRNKHGVMPKKKLNLLVTSDVSPTQKLKNNCLKVQVSVSEGLGGGLNNDGVPF